MTAPSPEDSNPFEAPRSEIGARASALGEDPATDAELIRRHHLGREKAVRMIGLLCYLVAAIAGFFSAFSLLFASGMLNPGRDVGDPAAQSFQWMIFALGFLFYGLICGVSAALGFGLRRLQVWARWTAMVLAMIVLLYLIAMAALVVAILPPTNSFAAAGLLLFFAAILGYVFYLLVTPRAGVVFSAEYRQVIARTPEIRAQAGRAVKVVVGLAVGVILLFVIAGIVSG